MEAEAGADGVAQKCGCNVQAWLMRGWMGSLIANICHRTLLWEDP